MFAVGSLFSCSRAPHFPDVYLVESGKFTEKRIPADIVDLLRNSDRFDLYSLEISDNPPDPHGFHDYPVIGKTAIDDKQLQTELVDELVRANSDWVDELGSTMPDCFEPRHGIRVERGGETMDFVICFTCRSANYYTSRGRSSFGLSSFPQRFNETLDKAGIRVVPER